MFNISFYDVVVIKFSQHPSTTRNKYAATDTVQKTINLFGGGTRMSALCFLYLVTNNFNGFRLHPFLKLNVSSLLFKYAEISDFSTQRSIDAYWFNQFLWRVLTNPTDGRQGPRISFEMHYKKSIHPKTYCLYNVHEK